MLPRKQKSAVKLFLKRSTPKNQNSSVIYGNKYFKNYQIPYAKSLYTKRGNAMAAPKASQWMVDSESECAGDKVSSNEPCCASTQTEWTADHAGGDFASLSFGQLHITLSSGPIPDPVKDATSLECRNKGADGSQLLAEIRALKLAFLQKHNEAIDHLIEKIEKNSGEHGVKIEEIVSQYDFLLEFMSKNDFQKKTLDDIQNDLFKIQRQIREKEKSQSIAYDTLIEEISLLRFCMLETKYCTDLHRKRKSIRKRTYRLKKIEERLGEFFMTKVLPQVQVAEKSKACKRCWLSKLFRKSK